MRCRCRTSTLPAKGQPASAPASAGNAACEDASVGDIDEGPPIDPGWHDAWIGILWVPAMFFFQLIIRRSKRSPLLLMRAVFVMFVTALILFGSVRATLGSKHPPWSARSAVGIGLLIAVLGLVEQAVPRRLVERPLPCGDASALAGAYRARFFLRMAFANAPALIAFEFSFITERWWVYLFGLVPAAVGFRYAAPTRSAIERDQRDLDDRDCDLSLLGALIVPRGYPARP
jgi:hypothetical protein